MTSRRFSDAIVPLFRFREVLKCSLATSLPRRGQVSDLTERNDASNCRAVVPLAELFGFTNALRSVSQGRASATMTPAGHQPTPDS